MRRFFVKNIIFIVILNILVKSVWVFFIDRTVQNKVGYAEYGTYQALFNLGLIFLIILDFGLTSYNSRVISQDPDKLETIFPTMLSARLVLAFFYGVVLILTTWLTGHTQREIVLVSGIMLIMTFITLLQFIRSNVAALQKFKLDGILSVSDRFLMILVCGFLLWNPLTAKNFKIEWFIISQIICYGAACILGIIVLRRLHPVKLGLSFHIPSLYKIIKDNLPYALFIFLMAVYIRTDMIMLERMVNQGKIQAGIYASAYRLLEVSNNMSGLIFAGVLLPLFGKMLAQKTDIQPIIRVSVNILLPIAMTLCVAALFLGEPIMHKLYKTAGAYDGYVFFWLMASFPAWCLMYVYSTLLTANGSLKTLNTIAFAGVVLNLGLNLYMIPSHMALGAAITACLTQWLVAICSIIACEKILNLKRSLLWILAHAGYLGMAVLIGYGVTHYGTQTNVKWELQLVVIGAACILLMLPFRFISVKAIGQLLKRP